MMIYNALFGWRQAKPPVILERTSDGYNDAQRHAVTINQRKEDLKQKLLSIIEELDNVQYPASDYADNNAHMVTVKRIKALHDAKRLLEDVAGLVHVATDKNLQFNGSGY